MVCVNLVDRTEPTTITDLAENNNVPIIFFNRELVAEDLERWKDLYYVGADASEYSVNTMVEKGVETEKLGYAIANWNRAQAQTKTAAMLTQFNGKIELIIANNDDMALGAIDALKASQIPKEEWPGVVGIDGTDAGLDAVRNEEMLGTVYNDKEGQAQEMLNLAFAIATNGTKENIPLIDGKYVRTPYHKVTQDNIEDYENKQGAVD